jgi:hypothetical protein
MVTHERDGQYDRDGTLTRREMLAAAVTNLAGCSALPPLGGGVRFGRVDAPAPEPPVYRPWLPDPGTLHLPDDDGVDVIHSAPARWLPRRWPRSSASTSAIRPTGGYAGTTVQRCGISRSA